MPELPEVETIVRTLRPHVEGRRIALVGILDPKLWLVEPGFLAGRQILEVRRVGKEVGLLLESWHGDRADPFWILFHLRMTGRLLHVAAGQESGRKEIRVGFRLDDGSRVLFDDARRLGTMRLATQNRIQAEVRGIDPLGPGFTEAALAQALGNSRRPVKPLLMDQKRISGIGNIYASEILFVARVHPSRSAKTLSPVELEAIHTASVDVLNRAVEACGTTFDDFLDAHGAKGKFQDFLMVYGREGEPCRLCAHPIRRVVQQQRSTFFCPSCQSRARVTRRGSSVKLPVRRASESGEGSKTRLARRPRSVSKSAMPVVAVAEAQEASPAQ